MMEFYKTIERITDKHSEYKKEAYAFVMAALHYAMSKMEKHGHLSGGELCLAIKEYALEQFGPLVRTVFEYWGIQNTLDFGKIVYYMIDANLMGKTDDDKLEDFDNVYDFNEAFSDIDYDL